MYRPNYFVEGGNMAMNNKKPAMLQAFYKLVYATEPAVLSGKDVVYIFKNDDSILKSFLTHFRMSFLITRMQNFVYLQICRMALLFCM